MKIHSRDGLAGFLILLGVLLVLVVWTPHARAESDIAEITKAAKHGDARAQYNLGSMYEAGEGMPKDYKKAVFWYKKAAKQGNEDAQFVLGGMYDKGRGVTNNAKQAIYWYRRAAEQGVPEAQNNLGIMYAEGRGVTQDDLTAYAWFSLAAAQGDDDGVYNRDILADKLTPEQCSEAQSIAAELQAKIDSNKQQ